MPSKDFGEDAAFFLYLVPIVAGIAYGAYQWAITAKTWTMPPSAYLVVSKSPYLFIISLAAILAAIILEVRSASITERNSIIQANTFRLQILAVVVLIISFAAAISAASYDLAGAFSLFVNGRYPIIFAFFLVGISFLLIPKQFLGNAKRASIPDLIGLILIVLAPIVYYGGAKISLPFALSASLAIIVGLIGLVLILAGPRLFGAKKEAKQVEAPQVATV